MASLTIEYFVKEPRIAVFLRPFKTPALLSATVASFSALSSLFSSLYSKDCYNEDFKNFASYLPPPNSPAHALGQEIQFLATRALTSATVGAVLIFTISSCLTMCSAQSRQKGQD